ncbi:uncharacterized protein LOC6606261 isoform X2 [Drosophila sechellia]|uniref:uncharacterized protein LOC6606261 isoform X2 n=1 Tax=Drosophila sechellia TaxID=7238 RepID=UPI0013DDA865|nr:uncharacterized protein LOC6606261 isoform X2 [Drosophila sechellia]
MIVEIVENPAALEHHYFNDHLNNAEKVLHRIEAYNVKLNNHIRKLKELLAKNRRLIAGLSYNEHSIKSLLENKAQDKQIERKSSKRRCHLRRTCKATDIREACWTQCKSHMEPEEKEQAQDVVEIQRKSQTSRSCSGKLCERQKGGKELSSYYELSEEIGFKVKCMLKLVERMDFKTATIAEVKTIRRRVLRAISSRQKNSSESEGVWSHLIHMSKNPYLPIFK